MQGKNRYGIIVTGMMISLLFTGCGKMQQARENYDMALLAVKEEQYEIAKEDFEKALLETEDKKAKSLNKKAYYGMGVCAFWLRDYIEAEINFEKSLSLETSEEPDTEILKYLIDTKCNLEKYEEALEFIAIIKNQKSNDFNLFWKEYGLLRECKLDKEAKDLLNQGLEIKGHGNDYNYNRAKIYYYLGNIKKAEEGMEEALKEEITEGYFFLGAIYQEKEAYQQAIENYQKYLETEGMKSGYVFNKMGYCFEILGEEEKALTIYQEGIAFSNSDNVISRIGSGEDGDFLKDLRFREIVLLENKYLFTEALEKCREYVKDYPEDKIMKRELDFLKTR